MSKIPKSEYITQAKTLSKEETERVLSRMGGKLPRRLEKRKLSQEEAIALQLELEDEQLEDWRKVMRELKEKNAAKDEKSAPHKTTNAIKGATPPTKSDGTTDKKPGTQSKSGIAKKKA